MFEKLYALQLLWFMKVLPQTALSVKTVTLHFSRYATGYNFVNDWNATFKSSIYMLLSRHTISRYLFQCSLNQPYDLCFKYVYFDWVLQFKFQFFIRITTVIYHFICTNIKTTNNNIYSRISNLNILFWTTCGTKLWGLIRN